MGVQSMVKQMMVNMKKNNTSNPQTARLWSRRVTDIAADLERSGDTAKKEKFEKLITAVAAEFDGDDLQARTSPAVFLKRQTAILQAENQLNEFKSPPSDRETIMKEAARKDIQKLDKNLRDICESSLPLLREIGEIIPGKRSLKAGSITDETLAGNETLSKLQVAMDQVNNKILNLQEMGFIESKVMIAILQLEDPDAEPLHRHCGIDETFGELLQKAFMAGEGDAEMEGDEDEEDDDDIIPDVWIKKWDSGGNSVTKTGQWWEHQPESTKIRDVFAAASGAGPEASQKKWSVDIVAKKGDYVVALVNDNGVEMGKVVDLPSSRKMKKNTADHVKALFANHKVVRMLELESGKDVSQRIFSKLHYRPKTNPLYIELEALNKPPVDSHTLREQSILTSRDYDAPQVLGDYGASVIVRKVVDELYYRAYNDGNHILIQIVGQENPPSRLLPFLTIPYVTAQRIIYLARKVDVFHATSTRIARQALNLVILLNKSVNANLGPDIEQQSERINLSDNLMQLEISMEKWGAAALAQVEYDQRVQEITQQYTVFFQHSFYYKNTHGSIHAILQPALDYDKQNFALGLAQLS